MCEIYKVLLQFIYANNLQTILHTRPRSRTIDTIKTTFHPLSPIVCCIHSHKSDLDYHQHVDGQEICNTSANVIKCNYAFSLINKIYKATIFALHDVMY